MSSRRPYKDAPSLSGLPVRPQMQRPVFLSPAARRTASWIVTLRPSGSVAWRGRASAHLDHPALAERAGQLAGGPAHLGQVWPVHGGGLVGRVVADHQQRAAWRPARPPNSTPAPRTGSAAPDQNPPNCSSCSGLRASACTFAPAPAPDIDRHQTCCLGDDLLTNEPRGQPDSPAPACTGLSKRPNSPKRAPSSGHVAHWLAD